MITGCNEPSRWTAATRPFSKWCMLPRMRLTSALLFMLWVSPSSCGGESSQATMEPLSFFNDLSGQLEIVLTEPPVRISEALANEKAVPTARIKELHLNASVFEQGEFRALTEGELNTVVFHKRELSLQGHGDAVRHVAPNGEFFTVRDLLKAIEDTERLTRAQSKWFEGIDVHHVYLEGIRNKDDVWHIDWGS